MTTKPAFPHNYCIKSGVYSTQTKALEMKLNEYGEYTPLVTDSCQEIELLDAMSNTEHNEDTISKTLFSEINDIKHEPIIGYYSCLYAGYVAEGDYRKNSSSGGMGTWIFKELFERKLIDGVIHVKESNDGDGILFKYAVSQSVEEIQAGAKTKYYPAELSQVLKHIRETPGKYAVIGIPSIIMELRLLTIYDSIIKERVIYTIGLICGHQKTTKYAESLAWECGISPENLTGIDFRKKIENSPADLYSVEITGLIDGKKTTVTKLHTQFFAGNWGHGFFKSQFSDYTDDALNETADIALGDAWLDEYTVDSKGNNIIIVRNEVIAGIIKNGIANKKLHLDEITVKDIIRSQPGLIHHTRDELPYRLYRKDARKEWRPKKRLQASNNIPFLKRKIQDLREEIRDQSQIQFKLAVEKNDWEYFKVAMSKYTLRYQRIYKIIRWQERIRKLRRNGFLWAIKKASSKLARR